MCVLSFQNVEAQSSRDDKTESEPVKSTIKPAEIKAKDPKKDITKSIDKPLPIRLAANFSVKPAVDNNTK